MKRMWTLVKAFFGIKKSIKVAKKAKAKAGIWSTEFWMVLLSQGAPIALSVWGLIPPDLMIKIMACSGTLAGLYLAARTFVKSTETQKDDIVHNKIVKAIKPLADKLGIKLEVLPVDE